MRLEIEEIKDQVRLIAKKSDDVTGEIQQLIAVVAANSQAPTPTPLVATKVEAGETPKLGNPSFKYSRIEFPRFNGDDLDG